MIIEKAVLQRNQPRSTNVMWIRPMGDDLLIYVFNRGRWQSVKLADDKNTYYTGDDEALGIEEIKKVVGAGSGESGFSFEDSDDNTNYPDDILS